MNIPQSSYLAQYSISAENLPATRCLEKHRTTIAIIILFLLTVLPTIKSLIIFLASISI